MLEVTSVLCFSYQIQRTCSFALGLQWKL